MKKKHILIIAAVLLGVFWNIFIPGPRAANDFPYAYNEVVREGFNLPYTWTRDGSNMGSYSVATLWSWPMDVVYGLGGQLNISFSLLERLLGIFLVLTLGIWSMNKLLKYYNVGYPGNVVATLFYLLNSYILLLIDGGQFAIALSYTWLPYAYLAFVRGTTEKGTAKIYSALAVAVLGFLDIRFIYLLALLLLIHFIFSLLNEHKSWRKLFLSWINSALVTAIVLIGLNAYWILPALLAKAPELPATYGRVSQTSFLSFATLGHALFMLQPHWFRNIFGQITALNPLFSVIPVVALLAPVFIKKNRSIAFWLVAGVISIFLVKGSLEPLPQIYPWLFTNIPGFSLFRDPTKFFFLVALSYSFLLAFSVDFLSNRNYRLKNIFLLFSILYLAILTYPVYSNQMTGILSIPRNTTNFEVVNRIIKDNDTYYRVLWVPGRSPLGFNSSTNSLIELSRLAAIRPFAIGGVGTYEWTNFLREAPFIADLFDITGIKYVVYPHPDPARTTLKPDEEEYFTRFFDQLTNTNWVKSVSTVGESSNFIGVIETTAEIKKIFTTDDTWLVVGSDRIYWDLNEHEIENIGLVFVEERPGLMNEMVNNENIKIVLYDKLITDLRATLIPKEELFALSDELDFDPNQTGWWKREASDLLQWKSFLENKYNLYNLDFDYGAGWAISEGENEFTIDKQLVSKGEVLLARLMVSPRGGTVNFYQQDTLIGSIKTDQEMAKKVTIPFHDRDGVVNNVYEHATYNWFEVGRLVSDEPITIRTEGDINVVNVLASVTSEEWKQLGEKVNELQTKVVTLESVSNISANNVTVNYTKITPTHYKVNLNGLTQPTTLIFSENYDSLWELHSSSGVIENSFPVYSFVNGFTIPHDGEYDIVFSAQRYVYPGLIISASSALVVSIILIYYARKNH